MAIMEWWENMVWMESCGKRVYKVQIFQAAERDEDIKLDMENNSKCGSPDDEGDV